MYLVKTPWYLKTVYPSLIWDIKSDNTLYLTFDDGPIPFVTDEVLSILKDYNAKATFFCIGENAKQNAHVLRRVEDAGHLIGNHTYHHHNGWKTENALYEKDVEDCDAILHSPFFRPPYGRIGYQQIQDLKKKYSIIMWDVLSGDFDTAIDAGKCIRNVTENAVPGSIIVFHDSEKAKDRVLGALPEVLAYFSRKGYTFSALPQQEMTADRKEIETL